MTAAPNATEMKDRARSRHQRYAAQWLLESVIHVLKGLEGDHVDDLEKSVEKWHATERMNLIGELAKQHVRELAVVACKLSPWWKLKPLISQLEAMV